MSSQIIKPGQWVRWVGGGRLDPLWEWRQFKGVEPSELPDCLYFVFHDGHRDRLHVDNLVVENDQGLTNWEVSDSKPKEAR